MKRPALNENAVPVTSLLHRQVKNREGEGVGKIEEIVVDLEAGKIGYAVLSFGGAFALGSRLFAVPWASLSFDPQEKIYTLNINKKLLKEAPGFDKDNWPDFVDREWGSELHTYYGFDPYWE